MYLYEVSTKNQIKNLPHMPRRNLQESNPSAGPASVIVLATPTIRHFVRPNPEDKTEIPSVIQNRTIDWVEFSS